MCTGEEALQVLLYQDLTVLGDCSSVILRRLLSLKKQRLQEKKSRKDYRASNTFKA